MYKSSDNIWFVLVATPDKIPALAAGIGRADLLKDPRFADPAKLAANMSVLTAIIDETFSSQPIAHWREVLDKAHIPYGLVRDPQDVIKDPQLQANNIVVPLEGAGENLKLTISSPIQMHGVAKLPAKRAPELGEHNDEVLKELGFDAKEIERLRASGVIANQRSCKGSLGDKNFRNVGGPKLEKRTEQPTHENCYTASNFQTNTPIKRKVGRPLIFPRSKRRPDSFG